MVSDLEKLLIPILWSITNLNPICNFFLYTIRHKELRMSVLYLLKGELLTEAKMNVTQKTQVTKSAFQRDRFKSIFSTSNTNKRISVISLKTSKVTPIPVKPESETFDLKEENQTTKM